MPTPGDTDTAAEPPAILAAEREIMLAYSDTAKTFTQLALGALVLSITFFEKVIGEPEGMAFDKVLISAWSFWLVSVLAGALYQYLAVRYLEDLGEQLKVLRRTGHFQAFRYLAGSLGDVRRADRVFLYWMRHVQHCRLPKAGSLRKPRGFCSFAVA